MNKVVALVLILITKTTLSQEGKFSEFSYLCQDQTARPYIVYTPATVDTSKSQPLLVYLHGSISSPDLKNDPLGYMKKSQLLSLADKGGFYVMFSYGQQGATWFDVVGNEMVTGEINTLKEKFKINPDKVFLSGFSDGGSGALYVSITNPFAFAGFIAMNGSLNVANKLGEKKLFIENANHTPMYIINTTDDMLYPINQINPTIDFLKKYNQHITFATPEGNHEMSYLEQETANLLNFIRNQHRTFRTELSWETTTANESVEWIKILKIDTLLPQKDWHTPYELKVFNDKADFGLNFDYSYQGKGLKVSGFKDDNSAGKKMGVQIDDIILMMEQDTLKSAYSPYYYLAKKKAGDTTSITVEREKEEKILTGVFNEGVYYDVFKHQNNTGKIKAKIVDGKTLVIHTSRISEFSINVDELNAYDIKTILLNDIPVKIKERKGWKKITVD